MLERRLPQLRRRVRRSPAPRLLRGQGELDARDPRRLRALGSGFDVVSGGELARVVAAGGDPSRRRVLRRRQERPRWRRRSPPTSCASTSSRRPSSSTWPTWPRASGGARASASASIPTSTRARTRTSRPASRTSKFGIAFAEALALYRHAASLPSIEVTGIDCHIGSQITDLGAFAEAAARLLELVDALAREGIALSHVDVGGGLGIRYRDETPIAIDAYAGRVRDARAARARSALLFEPGRLLVADAGVLLTRVEYLKRGRREELRDRRRGDERPAASGAVRRMARGRSGAPARTATRSAGRSSARSAKAPTSWRTTGASRWPPATCWRSGAQAHTRWR